MGVMPPIPIPVSTLSAINASSDCVKNSNPVSKHGISPTSTIATSSFLRGTRSDQNPMTIPTAAPASTNAVPIIPSACLSTPYSRLSSGMIADMSRESAIKKMYMAMSNANVTSSRGLMPAFLVTSLMAIRADGHTAAERCKRAWKNAQVAS